MDNIVVVEEVGYEDTDEETDEEIDEEEFDDDSDEDFDTESEGAKNLILTQIPVQNIQLEK